MTKDQEITKLKKSLHYAYVMWIVSAMIMTLVTSVTYHSIVAEVEPDTIIIELVEEWSIGPKYSELVCE